jgi:heptosyltransferase-2
MSLRILIVRFGSLGDVVLTTPLVRAIRAAHPAADIVFATKRAWAPVLHGNPHLRDVVTLEPGESLAGLARRLRGRFDHRLDLHGNLRSYALRALLGGRWTSYRKRRTARRLLIATRWNVYGPTIPVAARYHEAARRLGVTPDGRGAEVFPSPDDLLRASGIAPPGAVVLAPGASRWTKRWPADHWRALAAALHASGFGVVGVGTGDERAILHGTPAIDAFGHPLGVIAALLRRARTVVANDSGLMHLATAVGTPVVVLAGPTVESFGSVLQKPLACRPCSPYGSATCPAGHHRCMTDILVDDVARAVTTA